jgi:hypothetical protein
MKKFISLGTECVEFLKATRASQGKFLLSYVFYLFHFSFSDFLFDFLFPFSLLQMLCRWPMVA